MAEFVLDTFTPNESKELSAYAPVYKHSFLPVGYDVACELTVEAIPAFKLNLGVAG